jgi:phage tail P2-like protein
MGDLYDFSITDLIPPSLKGDRFIVALGEAFQNEINSAYREAESISNFYDVDNLLESLLDFLAYQKHVDFYDITLPIEQKRELVKKAGYFHRLKGTPAAVESLISTLFKQGRVLEWFEYGGAPYHFKVRTNNFSVMGDQTEKFIKSLDSVKNLRSKLDIVEYEQTYSQSLEISVEYARYNYPFTIYPGIYTTGTGPTGPSALGRLIEQTIDLLRTSYYTQQNTYHFAGQLEAGSNTQVGQLQVDIEEAIEISQNYYWNLKAFNLCGRFFCGTEVRI